MHTNRLSISLRAAAVTALGSLILSSQASASPTLAPALATPQLAQLVPMASDLWAPEPCVDGTLACYGVSVSADGNKINILLSDAEEDVTVYEDSGSIHVDVSIDFEYGSLDASYGPFPIVPDKTKIYAELGGGDDDLNMAGISVDTRVRAGAGDDSVIGGEARDTIDGDAGDDVIEGKGGKDTLRGDAGDDALMGGTHRDTLLGGLCDDFLGGGNGDDTMNGGSGANFYKSALGRDTIDTSKDVYVPDVGGYVILIGTSPIIAGCGENVKVLQCQGIQPCTANNAPIMTCENYVAQ